MDVDADIALEEYCYRLGTELKQFAAEGNVLGIKKLIKFGLNVSRSVWSSWALCAAVNKSHVDVVKLLLRNYCDVNGRDEEGDTALHRAAFYGHYQICQILLDAGAKLNAVSDEGRTPIMEAARRGKVKVVRMLTTQRADLDVLTPLGETTLHLAAEGGAAAAIKAIYLAAWRNGYKYQKLHRVVSDSQAYSYLNTLELEQKDVYGRTALHAAAFHGHPSAIKVLIQLGALVNARDKERSTPLHIAIYFDREEAMRTLLQYNAKVNLKDKAGWTPLHKAVHWGRSNLALLLLRHGAKHSRRDKLDRTPRDLAVELGRQELVEMLDNYNSWVYKSLENLTQISGNLLEGDGDPAEESASKEGNEVEETTDEKPELKFLPEVNQASLSREKRYPQTFDSPKPLHLPRLVPRCANVGRREQYPSLPTVRIE